MVPRCIVFSLLALLTMLAPSGYAEDIFSLDLVKAQQEGELNKLKKEIIETKNDAYYGGEGRYEGIALLDLIKPTIITDDQEIRFIAKDGYVATAPLKGLPLNRAFVAVRDLLAPKGETWRPIGEGRELVSPAPFVLVWQGEYDKALPNPHQIVRIQIGTTSLVAIRPAEASALAGYELFKLNCSSCHSLNGVGGVIGPELNVPKNVTEYWSKENILALIEDPSNLRWGSRMPSFSHLSPQQREQIYMYLVSMKSQKVCNDKAECTAKFAK